MRLLAILLGRIAAGGKVGVRHGVLAHITCCHVCGDTGGRSLVREPLPAGFSKEKHLVKCESCAGNEFIRRMTCNLSRRLTTQEAFDEEFYECPGCQGLFYCQHLGIPYATENVSFLTCCPRCHGRLPNLSHRLASLMRADVSTVGAAPDCYQFGTGRPHAQTEKAFELLAEKWESDMTLDHFMKQLYLVKTHPYTVAGREVSEGRQVWVVGPLDRGQRNLFCDHLGDLTWDAFAMAINGTRALKEALNDSGVEVLKTMKR